ncbi:MAG: alcohol dehydrogenase catalytic domain-containing protein [Deltaproteobacteria bacterium]|nr:alcohol dehydrogenase catalytic domain-containing protein [Deltaproteobacteria bacterium]
MPELMTAVRFHGPGDLRFERLPALGRPGRDQAKVRVEAAGICGSDLHVSQTGKYVTQIPVIMGHEFSGTVLETGEDVRDLKPGDHVVGDSRVFCGQCASCARGQFNLCFELGFVGEVFDGAYAQEIMIGSSALVKIAPEVPFEMAALAEPLAVALHAVGQVDLEPGQTVLILGAGPVGALIHQVLVLKGMADIHLTDISQYRLRTIKKAHPQTEVSRSADEYQVVFETTGSEHVVGGTVPKVVAKKGNLVLVGLFRERVSFDFNEVVENEWSLKGCSVFVGELNEAVSLLEDHWPQFEHLVSHKMPLREFKTAFDLLLSPKKEAMKIVLLPN